MIMLASDHEGSDDSRSRRSLMKNLLHGLIFGRAANLAGTLHNPDEAYVTFFDGAGLGLSGGYLALEAYPSSYWSDVAEDRPKYLTEVPNFGWLGIRQAHRDEVLPPGPNPEPVSIEIIGEGRMACVARVWNPGDVGSCRRCQRCSAYASGKHPGFDACLVPIENYDGPTVEVAPHPTPDLDPVQQCDRILDQLETLQRRQAGEFVEVAGRN